MAYEQIYSELANFLGISVGATMVVLTLVSIWTFVWKGFALWKSAKKNHIVWFVALLIFNTLGILEILYIFVFSKMNFKRKGKKVEEKKVSVKKEVKDLKKIKKKK